MYLTFCGIRKPIQCDSKIRKLIFLRQLMAMVSKIIRKKSCSAQTETARKEGSWGNSHLHATERTTRTHAPRGMKVRQNTKSEEHPNCWCVLKGPAPFLGMMVKVEALSQQDRAKRSLKRQEKSSNEEMEEGPGAVLSCFAGADLRCSTNSNSWTSSWSYSCCKRRFRFKWLNGSYYDS